MKKILFLLLFLAVNILVKGQVIVTLNLPEPCESYQTSVFDKPEGKRAGFDFEVFPNPASSEFTIRVSASEKIGRLKVQIVSMYGNIVKSDDFYSENTAWIKTSGIGDLSPGVYIVTLFRKNEEVSKRLIIK